MCDIKHCNTINLIVKIFAPQCYDNDVRVSVPTIARRTPIGRSTAAAESPGWLFVRYLAILSKCVAKGESVRSWVSATVDRRHTARNNMCDLNEGLQLTYLEYKSRSSRGEVLRQHRCWSLYSKILRVGR
jgi:hypothetical protein